MERLCRYLLRPPLSEERLERRGEQIRLELKSTWRHGTTHLLYEPVELLERLAAWVPRPHKTMAVAVHGAADASPRSCTGTVDGSGDGPTLVNLVIYHGVLADNARWRKRVVAHGRPALEQGAVCATSAQPPQKSHRPNASWAELMRRGLDIDVLACPTCHGRWRFIAAIMRPAVARRILRSLGLPAEPIEPTPARAPPAWPDDLFDVA